MCVRNHHAHASPEQQPAAVYVKHKMLVRTHSNLCDDAICFVHASSCCKLPQSRGLSSRSRSPSSFEHAGPKARAGGAATWSRTRVSRERSARGKLRRARARAHTNTHTHTFSNFLCQHNDGICSIAQQASHSTTSHHTTYRSVIALSVCFESCSDAVLVRGDHILLFPPTAYCSPSGT